MKAKHYLSRKTEYINGSYKFSKNTKFAFGDLETPTYNRMVQDGLISTDEGKHKWISDIEYIWPYLGAVLDIDGNLLWEGGGKGSMLDMIYTLFRNNVNVLYFHNLSFDGAYILAELFNSPTKAYAPQWQRKEVSYKYEVKFKIPNDRDETGKMKFTYIITDKNKLLQITISNGDKVLHIYCSTLMFSQSVADLGKSIKGENMLKGDIDYHLNGLVNNVSEVKDYATVKEYLLQDINIVRHYFKELITNNKLVTIKDIKMTKGMMAWNYILKEIKKVGRDEEYEERYVNQLPSEKNGLVERIIINKGQDEIIGEKVYRGGYTSGNLLLQGKEVKGHIGCVDINSSYPNVMVNKALPYGKPQSFKDDGHNYGMFEITITYAKRKRLNYPAIIPSNNSSSSNKYFSDITKDPITLWVDSNDIVNYKMFYDLNYTINPLNQMWFKTDKFMGEFIQPIYDLKNEIKKSGRGGSSDYLFIKYFWTLCMASLEKSRISLIKIYIMIIMMRT